MPKWRLAQQVLKGEAPFGQMEVQAAAFTVLSRCPLYKSIRMLLDCRLPSFDRGLKQRKNFLILTQMTPLVMSIAESNTASAIRRKVGYVPRKVANSGHPRQQRTPSDRRQTTLGPSLGFIATLNRFVATPDMQRLVVPTVSTVPMRPSTPVPLFSASTLGTRPFLTGKVFFLTVPLLRAEQKEILLVTRVPQGVP